MDQLAEQISHSLIDRKSVKIAIVEFPDLDGKSSDLGRYLAEELTTRLFLTGGFQIIERSQIRKIIEEQKLSASGLVDEATASRLGRLLGVDALAIGTVADLKTSVKINARLISTETGTVFSVATANLPMTSELETLLGRKAGEATSGGFDGTWEVTVSSPPQGEALGYTMKFLATVKDGLLHGQFGTPGTGPCLALEGNINPDGTAVLTARGLTGDPRFNIRNSGKGTPYSYHVEAKFSVFSGTGHRIENRIGNLTFIKK